MFKEQIRELVISDNVHASIMNPIIQDLLGNTMENRASKIDEMLQSGTQVTFKANGIVRGVISTNGRSLEYEWDGTSLGVRQEGEVEYQFVNLKGEKGEQGIRGEQGIQGEKGDKGDGLHIDGLANSVEELPIDVPSGACYLIGTNLYYFNGTTWEDAGSIQGPEGKQGIQGERGLDGAQGIQGERGLDGAKGDKGDMGPQGPKGDTGAKGAQGIQGPKGDTGAKGATGATGPSGSPWGGGTFTGAIVAQTNANYTTRQVRNSIISTGNPSGGANGDMWFKYV